MKSGLRARARQVVLEITQRGIPDQLGLDALNAIPSTGARIALDDTTLSGATPLQVIAEGIESEAQARRLRAAGVQWGQGRHLSPPLPVEEFAPYFERAAAGR